MRLAKSRVHFTGIGGIGMCGLAELLHNMGASVQGSDLSENQNTIRMRELGIPIVIGQQGHNVNGVDVVVYSSAVKADNPEYQEAKKQGIPLIRRAEALAEIMQLKRGIAVGGTHGKTTTTSMTAAIFLHAHLDPTIVIGGRLDLIQSTAKLGSGEWLIAEADESDGSFNRLNPEIAIITNIDDDHLDYFKSFENLENAFVEFASRIPFYGAAVVCGDDPKVKKLFSDYPKRAIFYGCSEGNDYQLKGSQGNYQVLYQSEKIGSFELKTPGMHNALNALAAIIAGIQAGIPFDKCLSGIESFEGVDRRFQKRSEVNGTLFYDDYGHHPTEVEAVLSAFKEQYPKRTLKVLFQPHRYTRTEQCWKGFLTSFKQADEVFVLDIFEANEEPINNIHSKRLAEEMDHSQVTYLKDPLIAKEQVSKNLKSGDLLLTLGAGDVWKLGDEISRHLNSSL